jgi:cytidine deaminase
MDEKELIRIAAEVRLQAYAPYSNFFVGAALRTKSGRVFRGCNVENLSYRLTTCAEQAAICAAVAEGEKEFVAIAVVTDAKEPAVPCGACRQALAEFNPDMKVVMHTVSGKTETSALRDLLPRPSQGILESRRNV